MTNTVIFTALLLPDIILKSLVSGSSIAVLANSPLVSGTQFALSNESTNENGKIKLAAWAKCELYQVVDKNASLEILALHTGYSLELFKAQQDKLGNIFLAYLRVYRLLLPVEIISQSRSKIVQIPNIHINEFLPVLSDRDFTRLKQRLENLEPPESLDAQIQRMLEEVEIQRKIEAVKKLAWIKTISSLGDRSIKEDQGKSNYQAGTDFENITKKGLEFLGFTVDEFYRGGAGGLDLFCSKPYALAAECKAGKSVPDTTVDQLQRIARRNLKENYHLAIGLIICSAEPSSYLKDSALVSKISEGIKINILNAMTLQKLVELKAKYDGAINLTELRKYFQTGQIDSKIDEYIQKVEGEIKLRSRIVQAVKRLADMGTTQPNFERICTQYNAMFFKDNESVLQDPIVRDLLIELSSPLAGYLGRVEEDGKKCDRFYYLRDLVYENFVYK